MIDDLLFPTHILLCAGILLLFFVQSANNYLGLLRPHNAVENNHFVE